MASGAVKLRIPRRVLKKLLGTSSPRPTMGLDEVLEKYSGKVEEDVLKEFLREGR